VLLFIRYCCLVIAIAVFFATTLFNFFVIFVVSIVFYCLGRYLGHCHVGCLVGCRFWCLGHWSSLFLSMLPLSNVFFPLATIICKKQMMTLLFLLWLCCGCSRCHCCCGRCRCRGRCCGHLHCCGHHHRRCCGCRHCRCHRHCHGCHQFRGHHCHRPSCFHPCRRFPHRFPRRFHFCFKYFFLLLLSSLLSLSWSSSSLSSFVLILIVLVILLLFSC